MFGLQQMHQFTGKTSMKMEYVINKVFILKLETSCFPLLHASVLCQTPALCSLFGLNDCDSSIYICCLSMPRRVLLPLLPSVFGRAYFFFYFFFRACISCWRMVVVGISLCMHGIDSNNTILVQIDFYCGINKAGKHISIL